MIIAAGLGGKCTFPILPGLACIGGVFLMLKLWSHTVLGLNSIYTDEQLSELGKSLSFFFFICKMRSRLSLEALLLNLPGFVCMLYYPMTLGNSFSL